MTLSHIVAVSTNHVIGKKGKLPWDLPEDLKFFREKTEGRLLIMGRKTFESLKAPLKNRFHIVLTRKKNNRKNFEDVIFLSSLKKALSYAKSKKETYGNKIFIIGGEEIYTQTLPFIYDIYLTRIYKVVEGDAFYPKVDLKRFKKISEKKAKNFDSLPLKYSFLYYQRMKSF